MRDTKFLSLCQDVVGHMDHWEMCYSPNRNKRSIIAENGIYAIRFTKQRQMMRAEFQIHPELKVDKNQSVKRILTTLPITNPQNMANIIVERFVPRVKEQTKRLIL